MKKFAYTEPVNRNLVIVVTVIVAGRFRLQGEAEKSGPLKFFAVFSATIWSFNLKFYRFIY